MVDACSVFIIRYDLLYALTSLANISLTIFVPIEFPIN